MEIERKFLIKDLHSLPFSIEAYPHRELEQAYLCTGPVVRIRKDDEQYFLTYKSKGLMIREEYNLLSTARLICISAKKLTAGSTRRHGMSFPLTKSLIHPRHRKKVIFPHSSGKKVFLFSLNWIFLKAILPHCFSQRLNFLTRKLHVTIRLLTGLVKMSHTCLCTTTVL